MTRAKYTKTAFSLIELLIILIILSVMAAMVIPEFQNNSRQAKEAAARDNLRILRNAIEVYTAQHKDAAPGYADSNTDGVPTRYVLASQLLLASNASGGLAAVGTSGYDLGPYLTAIPENTLNNKVSFTIITNSAEMPSEADGDTGWIYKPATKEIRLNYPGTDLSGVSYYSY